MGVWSVLVLAATLGSSVALAQDNMMNMQEIAQGLGVKCEYCHAGQRTGQPRAEGQAPTKQDIARAMIASPKLILADEPTGNLDSANGEEVMQLLTELNGEGTTVVMVTHSHSHAEYAHRIVNLLDGALVTENIRRLL